MLDFNDPRWPNLEGGYKKPKDVRPLLHALENANDDHAAWAALWQELYHQGHVGHGSFVAVPHLVRIHRARGLADWNTYALVASIELARGVGQNPDVPSWAHESYMNAIRELAHLGLIELPRTSNAATVRSILAILAITHGVRAYGRILVELTEDEVVEFLENN